MGVAARRTGVSCDAYRPAGISAPLSPAKRFLRLMAAFNVADPAFRRSTNFGQAVWYGIFDSAYTRPGDYLKESASARVWFIAAQPNLLPVVCVLTNRVVSFFRPEAPKLPGRNQYGGVDRSKSVPLLANWPACVLAGHGGEREPAGLPSDVRLGGYKVLLPAGACSGCQNSGVSPKALRTDDFMTDDLGRSYVIDSAELTELGWRLSAKLATT
jgi:hypothetical protein